MENTSEHDKDSCTLPRQSAPNALVSDELEFANIFPTVRCNFARLYNTSVALDTLLNLEDPEESLISGVINMVYLYAVIVPMKLAYSRLKAYASLVILSACSISSETDRIISDRMAESMKVHTYFGQDNIVRYVSNPSCRIEELLAAHSKIVQCLKDSVSSVEDGMRVIPAHKEYHKSKRFLTMRSATRRAIRLSERIVSLVKQLNGPIQFIVFHNRASIDPLDMPKGSPEKHIKRAIILLENLTQPIRNE